MTHSILITGGAGFIGSHVCLKLLENGFSIFVVDSLSNSSTKVIKKIEDYFKTNLPDADNSLFFFKGDIRDLSLLNKIFNFSKKIGKNIEAVIHLAGLKSVNESISKPLSYWDNNLYGALVLLKAMIENNCSTLVFSSSASIYDQSEDEKIKENTRINPINPYGQTKATIEKLLKDIYDSDPENWRIANLRYFNPLGAHPSGVIGEDFLGTPSNLFPNILKVALKAKKELYVYGNDWPTFDGTCIRDYIHVVDLADGHIMALKYLLSLKNKYINLNLGTGNGKSVLEVIKVFEETIGIQIPYLIKEKREGDRGNVVADVSYSKSILGWTASLSLEDMCRDSWRWVSSEKN